ncbi:TonB-dependent receptor [Pedobacter sp. BS3]|uniref:SusC/RagA family TonB-linked outer membrane protein n=1 Tax=Pedobacter sp. BS3 TaxID=2567937 RepID=UPI0011F091BC|nr:TonB-dependent receptor [Pedobacter sp. BS3]TZF83224.1 TonB-dependent receptor [Pedobacter sp. BS3]
MKHQFNKNISAQPGVTGLSFSGLRLKKVVPLLLCCSAFLLKLNAQPVQYEANVDSIARVAYGTQAKDQVTSAISSVSGAELRKIQTATLTNALIGKLPGVTIMGTGGAPGFDEPSITVRGQHTSLSNGVLLLVDGIQVNNISFLSPDEIESVTVLKDAAALALYGAKGGNGVLLVTTRRGNLSNKTNISLNARYGSQSAIQLPKLANSYDFARLYNEARQNDGLPPTYTATQLEGYRLGTDPYLYPNVNWFDEILRKNSPIQDYSVTFDGGNQTAKYFVMAGFMNNQGLYAGTDQTHNSNLNYNCLNFRANLDLNLSKGFSAQVGLGGNIQDRRFPPVATATFWQNMITYAPNLYSVRTPDGRVTGSANYPSNPLGDLLERGYQSRHDRNIQMNVRATQKLDFITDGLKIFGAVLFDNLLQNRYDKTRNYAYYEPLLTTGSNGQDSIYYQQQGLDSDLSVVTGNDYENNRIIFQGGFDFDRKFNQHEVGGMIFFQQDKYTVLGNQSAFAMQNLAGRITYNYKEKYFAEGAFSYSGLENYPPGHRFGFFPAISAAWLMHKEDFLKSSKWINYLKLRASAGMVGNDRGASRFNYNQYWGTASSQGYYFGTGQNFSSALVQLGMANPDITWETGRILNFGVDAALFNNKLSINADVFHENRSDILVNMSGVTSALAGYTAGVTANKGRVIDYGTEIAATYNGDAGKVKYYVGGQFTYAFNKIKESYETPKKETYSYRQGHPVGQYFGLEAIGYFRDESDIISSPVQTFSTVRPGDLKYKDQNGDGIIDVNDQIAIGKANYPQINYGVNTGVAFNGFNLDLFFQGVANRSVYLSGYLFQPFTNNANVLDWAVNGRWTPETRATATYPRLTTQSNANNYQASTFWVRNANFLRLRNIELGYTLSKKAVAKMGLESIKFYVSGMNLLTWDDLAVDVDPETLSMGYPTLKSYSAGISVKF